MVQDNLEIFCISTSKVELPKNRLVQRLCRRTTNISKNEGVCLCQYHEHGKKSLRLVWCVNFTYQMVTKLMMRKVKGICLFTDFSFWSYGSLIPIYCLLSR